jgi:hypothetical protein
MDDLFFTEWTIYWENDKPTLCTLSDWLMGHDLKQVSSQFQPVRVRDTNVYMSTQLSET